MNAGSDFSMANFSQPGGSAEDLERQKRRLAGSEKGPTTAASSSAWVNWGEHGRLLGSPFDATNIPLTKLEQMRRDPMIAFGLMFIKVFLARAPWYIKSTDARRAAFIDGALRKIYGRFVLQYGGCLDFGYQGLVKNFERGDADWVFYDAEGKEIPVWTSSAQPLLWKPFTALNPRRVSPAFTESGDFNGIWLRPYMSNVFPYKGSGGEPEIPRDWSLWCTNEKDSVFGSLWGYPRTGYAYRYWWAYWYRFGLADRAFEKWADPPVIAYHPTQVEADSEGNIRNFTEEGLALAEKLRSGGNVSLPSDVVESMMDGRVTSMRQWQLEQLESTANFDALNEGFSYLDIAKLRAMMVPEQAFLEGKGGTSSRNVASTLGDVFEESQAVLKAEIDDHLNRYVIPQLLEVNFGPGGPACTIETTGFDAQDVETSRAIIQAFAQNAPGRLSSVDFRKLLTRLGVPLLAGEEQAKQAEEMAKEAALRGPARMPARDGNAGVNNAGLYYDDPGRERIELEEERRAEERREERGFFMNALDKLLGRGEPVRLDDAAAEPTTQLPPQVIVHQAEPVVEVTFESPTSPDVVVRPPSVDVVAPERKREIINVQPAVPTTNVSVSPTLNISSSTLGRIADALKKALKRKPTSKRVLRDNQGKITKIEEE